MKKFALLVTVLALSLSFSACSDDDDRDRDRDRDHDSDLGFPGKEVAQEMLEESFETSVGAMGNIIKEGNDANNKRIADRKKTYEKNKVKVNKTITTNEATIKFKSYAIMDQEAALNDEKVLVMTFDYTNNDEEHEWNFSSHFDNAFQGGVGISSYPDSLDKDVYSNIRQGTTLEIVATLSLRNETDSIELVFNNIDYEVSKDGKSNREISYKLDI